MEKDDIYQTESCDFTQEMSDVEVIKAAIEKIDESHVDIDGIEEVESIIASIDEPEDAQEESYQEDTGETQAVVEDNVCAESDIRNEKQVFGNHI